MARFKEYKRRNKVYLSVVENEDIKAEFGTTFIVYPSLLRLDIENIPIIPRFDFVSPLTTRVPDRTRDDGYLLYSASHDDSCPVNTFPLVGRRIISGEVHRGPTLKIFREFSFILKYLKWVEHILSSFESQLRTFRLFNALYSSLYTYDRNSHVIHTRLRGLMREHFAYYIRGNLE